MSVTDDSRNEIEDAESARRIGDDAGNVCEDLFGVSMTRAGYGWAAASMAVPAGVGAHAPLPPELLAPLADVAIGRSLLTTIPPPGGCRTAQLHIDVTGVPVVTAQDLTARGDLVSRDDNFGLSVATISDAAGAVLLRASGWLAVVPAAEQDVPTEADRPRPPRADLAELIRLLTWESAGGSGERVVRTVPEMANRFHIMHGGMQLSLLLAALRDCSQNAIDHPPRLLSVDVVLHRPAPVNDAVLTASCHVVRAGSRVLTVSGELIGPHVKALITGTAVFDATGS